MKFDFDELLKNILVNENIFKPNLTSKLSFETAMTEIQNSFKTLDLGCGCGVVGIAVLKNISSVEMCCSDLDSKSIEMAKKNYMNHNLSADIRAGNLFDPWSNVKFDYIINDVTGISSVIAKKSPWFSDKIPSDSGDDGSDLTLSIINKAPDYLKKNGSMQIPLISLSNTKKIIQAAKEKFSEVKIIRSKDWFLPKEMESLKKTMYLLKSKNHINFEEKFGKIICNTSIAVCKKAKLH